MLCTVFSTIREFVDIVKKTVEFGSRGVEYGEEVCMVEVDGELDKGLRYCHIGEEACESVHAQRVKFLHWSRPEEAMVSSGVAVLKRQQGRWEKTCFKVGQFITMSNYLNYVGEFLTETIESIDD
ncbi:hypothetical protein Tco_1435512 [Tanacetum coccineum]